MADRKVNEGLDEGHEQFEHAHEHGEDQREHADALTQSGVDLAEDEDEREEAEHDDVARRDVGEQSDHEDGRAQEHARISTGSGSAAPVWAPQGGMWPHR